MADQGHWYDNNSTLGLGLGMIMMRRQYMRQQAAEAPYKEAEFQAWWAGLTPVQQAAYNDSLAQVPRADPQRAAKEKTKRAVAKLFVCLLVLGMLAVVGAVEGRAQTRSDQQYQQKLEASCGSQPDPAADYGGYATWESCTNQFYADHPAS